MTTNIWLLGLDTFNTYTSFHVTLGTCKIGRAPGADVCLTGCKDISRTHLVLFCDATGQIQSENMGISNTYHGDRPLDGIHPLQDGDILHLGTHTLVLATSEQQKDVYEQQLQNIQNITLNTFVSTRTLANINQPCPGPGWIHVTSLPTRTSAQRDQLVFFTEDGKQHFFYENALLLIPPASA